MPRPRNRLARELAFRLARLLAFLWAGHVATRVAVAVLGITHVVVSDDASALLGLALGLGAFLWAQHRFPLRRPTREEAPAARRGSGGR